jgi:hypothetical protein
LTGTETITGSATWPLSVSAAISTMTDPSISATGSMAGTIRKTSITSSKMDRPKIKDFMPEETTFSDIHRKFRDNPDLYRYICALDLYIDELEDTLKPREPFNGAFYPSPILKNNGEDLNPEKERYKSKFQRKLDEAIAKGEEARKAKTEKTKNKEP